MTCKFKFSPLDLDARRPACVIRKVCAVGRGEVILLRLYGSGAADGFRCEPWKCIKWLMSSY